MKFQTAKTELCLREYMLAAFSGDAISEHDSALADPCDARRGRRLRTQSPARPFGFAQGRRRRYVMA